MFKEYRLIGKNIHSYEEALNIFLPKNLAHLTREEKSPFYIKNLEKKNRKKIGAFPIPYVRLLQLLYSKLMKKFGWIIRIAKL